MTWIRGVVSLEIETENLAAWMDINNNFRLNKGQKPDAQKDYWTGLLLQFGTYKAQGTGDYMKGFDRIELYSGQEESPAVTIDQKTFTDRKKPTWINVVARIPGSAKNPPMTEDHLEKVYLKENLRSLDHYFKPFPGGITFWSETGYDLKVRENKERWPYKRYTFTSREKTEYEVEIRGKGAPTPPPREITKIKILAAPGLPTESHQSPPQNP